MSTAATNATINPDTATYRRPRLFGAVVRSEWTKLRTVRSMPWTLVATVVLTVGIGVALTAASVSQASAAQRATLDPTASSLAGLSLAQLAIGVLGVLVMTSEYATGMIRATLTAVSHRGRLMWAKALVAAVVAFVVGVVSSFIAFFAGQAIAATQHVQISLSSPGVARAVIGGGLYLAVLGLLALGLGTILRRTAAAVAAIVGLVVVLPQIAASLPSSSWQDTLIKVLPSTGEAIYRVHHQASALGPWAGFAVLCAWAAASLIAGWALLSCRDA